MNANTPVYQPNFWEKQYGYIQDGIFYRPSFSIYRNGKPVDLDDNFDMGYSYEIANHIVIHLKAVSDDDFAIKPLAWIPTINYQLNDEHRYENSK